MQIAKWARMRRKRGRRKMNREKKVPNQTIPSADFVVVYQCKCNREFALKYKIIQHTNVFSRRFFFPFFVSFSIFGSTFLYDLVVHSKRMCVPQIRRQQRQLILSKRDFFSGANFHRNSLNESYLEPSVCKSAYIFDLRNV